MQGRFILLGNMRCTYIISLCDVTDSLTTQQQQSSGHSHSPINVHFASFQFKYEKNHT